MIFIIDKTNSHYYQALYSSFSLQSLFYSTLHYPTTLHHTYNNQKPFKQMLYKDAQSFQPIQQTQLINLPKAHINISVLRHLSQPLQILDKDDSYLNFADPVCSYIAKLHTLPERILPTTENTQLQNLQPTRLISMENVESEFQQVRRMYERSRYRTQQDTTINNEQELQNEQKPPQPKVKTLYNMFSNRTPYYCRFQHHTPTKNNFANVFMNVGGVNLQAKAYTAKSLPGGRKFPRLNNSSKTAENRFNRGNMIFDSSFQSGNLLYVFQKPTQMDGQDVYEYQLVLQNDTNTYGHNQWFFFRVQSLKPHHTVKFSVVNLIKSDSLFNYGLKPLVFSERDNSQKSVGWLRRGENVRYCQSDVRRENKKENYFALEFEYTFKETKDWVYFCPSYPYTYAQMTSHVQNLYQEPEYKKCFSIKTVCETLGRNKVSLITVSTGQKMIEDCKVVWILARQHPAETTGSYMVEGILRYLLPLISQAKSSLTESSLGQLHDYVFKIVPMVNIDGVIHGNSRAELIGLDPNRAWRRPRKTVNPVVYHLMKEIMSYKSNVSLVLDLHSHSKKTGCFFYGNQLQSNRKLSKLYPTIICQNDPRFTLKNCRYHGGYKTTARHTLFRDLPTCQNIFTVECSLLGYHNPKTNRITEYTIQDYHEMGAKLIETFFRLENIKLEKGVGELLEEFDGRIGEVCEVDSARSDSGVSEDQYEEVKELERRLVNHNNRRKLKTTINGDNNRKNNKSMVAHLNKNEKDDDPTKRRSCSYAKPKVKNPLLNLQTNNTATLLSSIKQVSSKNFPRGSESTTKGRLYFNHHPVAIKNQTQPNDPSLDNTNTISSLKRSYMKYMPSLKPSNESRDHTQEIRGKVDEKVTRQFGTQAMVENHTQSSRRVLEPSQNPLNTLTIISSNNNTRPLLVLGSTCQTQYTLFPNNEISLQVNPTQDDAIKKEHRAIAKLPKLMGMISASKERIRKVSMKECKENRQVGVGTTMAKFTDVRAVVGEERLRRNQKLAVNFGSGNG